VILQLLLQISIIITGNYNFFNFLTIALMMKVWEYDDDHEIYSSRGESDADVATDYALLPDVKLQGNANFLTKPTTTLSSHFSSSNINYKINYLISSLSNHIDQQGPFAAAAQLFQSIDTTNIGVICQVLCLLLFIGYCTMTMISFKTINKMNHNLSYGTLGANLEIKWNIPYEDMEKIFPIICPMTIGKLMYGILPICA